MENYEYNVEEKSLTQNFLIKYIWLPVSLRIPNAVTPNMISVFGFIVVFISIFGLWLVEKGHSWGFLLTAASTFIYMLCDNVDGLHARRTKQTSRLGEFLDHWLDSIAFIVVNSCIAYTFGLTSWVFALYITLMVIAFYATMWEHHYTGIFISGAIGSNESLLVYTSFYTALFFVGKQPWLVYHDSIYSVAVLLTSFAIIGSFFTAMGCLVRVKKHFGAMIVYCAAMITIGYFFYAGYVPQIETTILFALTNTILCGKLIKEHLLKVKCSFRYSFVYLFVFTAILLVSVPSLHQYFFYYLYATLVAIAITAMSDAVQTIAFLRK